MSRYKIATKTDTLRYKIAKEVFGEIEDSDGIRDIPSWEIFEKCLEQHKRIAELEEQLKKKPKYNIGDRVYLINQDYEVEEDFVETIDIDIDVTEYYTVMYSICWYENELFATKEEAFKKLEELKGE